ncbi:MAG: hypothetical protein OXL37_12325 [Chloroflexota bacterium]|nr:hypothetical protein [Chloroflexota bacterium]MDE2960868.1 hypothetical protein [Chloroflexota bacterium]
MSTPFRIEHELLNSEMLNGADDAVRAAVSIWLSGVCVTEAEDRAGEIYQTRRSVRVSMTRMARWFAGNWWRLRWEPEERRASPDWQMSHNLAAAGGGYLWPNLTFSCDGETVLAVTKAGDPNSAEPIRYLLDYAGIIPAVDFERVVDEFIATTIDCLPAEARKNTELVDLWAEVARERAEPELYALRKLEAGLGYDPGEAPDTLIATLLKQRSKYGAGAIQEIAAASKDNAIDHLESMANEVRGRGVSARLPACDTIREQHRDQIKPLDAPWRRGEQAARIARGIWGLPSGPIQTSTLADLFGVSLDERPQSELPLSVGLRDDGSDVMSISLHQHYLTGRRFTLARLIGDQVAAPPEERLLPATAARTSRQKFQRAFAREMLCPISDLLDFLGPAPPNDDDIDDAAAHFQVSDRVVAFALVNNGVIQRESMGEWAV